MKVLHVINSANPKTGGTYEALRLSTTAMLNQAIEVEVLSLDHPTRLTPEAAQLPAKIHLQGAEQWTHYGYSKLFKNWLSNNIDQYDAVVIHGLWQYHHFATSQACRKHRVPYFTFTHGMLDPWFNKTYPLKYIKKLPYWLLRERASLQHATAVLFTIEEERRLARQSFPFYQVNEKVVGLGTTTPEYALDNLKALFQADPPAWGQRPFFLFMSRIQEKKGLDLLVEAYAKLRATEPTLPDLVIAGPEQQPEYAAAIRKNYPQDGVHWIGNLSGHLKWQTLAAAEAMVLTSHQENFGIVVVEALMVGTPVLISNQVNIWPQIEQSKAGFVDQDTSDGARRLIQSWLTATEADRQSMAVAAKKAFKDHFEIEGSTKRLLQCIRESIH